MATIKQKAKNPAEPVPLRKRNVCCTVAYLEGYAAAMQAIGVTATKQAEALKAVTRADTQAGFEHALRTEDASVNAEGADR